MKKKQLKQRKPKRESKRTLGWAWITTEKLEFSNQDGALLLKIYRTQKEAKRNCSLPLAYFCAHLRRVSFEF